MRFKLPIALIFLITAPALADIEVVASIINIAPDPFTAWFCGNYMTCIVGVYAEVLALFILLILALLLGIKLVRVPRVKPVLGEPGIFRVYYPYWLSADEQVLVGEVVEGVLKKGAVMLNTKGRIGRAKRIASNRDGELWSVTDAKAGAYVEATISNKKRVKIQKGENLTFSYSQEEEKDEPDSESDGFSIVKGRDRKDLPDKSSP